MEARARCGCCHSKERAASVVSLTAAAAPTTAGSGSSTTTTHLQHSWTDIYTTAATQGSNRINQAHTAFNRGCTLTVDEGWRRCICCKGVSENCWAKLKETTGMTRSAAFVCVTSWVYDDDTMLWSLSTKSLVAGRCRAAFTVCTVSEHLKEPER